MRLTIWLFAAVLLAADPQRVSKDEELEVLRSRVVLQSAQDTMRQAESIWNEQKKIFDAEKPKHDALLKKLKDNYAAKGLDLSYDLTLKPSQKPAAEAKK